MNKLSFKLAVYNYTGYFEGWEDLTGQLFLCEPSDDLLQNYLNMGEIRKLECRFDLKNLLSKETLPNYANKFFDMFLVDSNGNLIDVPVRIEQA